MKKPRKILLFLKLPPPYGGGEIINQIIYDALKIENSFRIFIIRSGAHSNKFTQGKFSLTNTFNGLQFLIKAFFIVLFAYPEKIYISIPKDFLSFFRNSLLIIFCKILRIKVYGDLAGMSFPFMTGKSKSIRKYGMFIFGLFDNIRILGDNVKRYIPYIDSSKLISFPNGISKHETGNDNSCKFFNASLQLLYVGSIESSKGFDRLIQAMILCRHENMDVILNVLGEWKSIEFRKWAERTISMNGLDRIVKFKGLLIGEQKWEVFRISDVLIHPTIWDGQPVSILEALSMGLIIIATNTGAIPDTINNGINGSIIDSPDPEIIFEKIKGYYNNREIGRKISLYNKTYFSKHFSKDIFIQKFSDWLLAKI